MVAARKLGRPVHWMASRSEAFLTDNQGRDTSPTPSSHSMRRAVSWRCACGSPIWAPMSAGARISPPTILGAAFRPFTHPEDRRRRALRLHQYGADRTLSRRRPAGSELRHGAAGRRAARATGLDRVALRRRNLIPRPSHSLHDARSARPIDSGEFETILDNALALSGYATFKERRRRPQRGELRGIGLSCFLEHAGGMPTEGASSISGRREADRSGSACNRPGRGTPRSSATCSRESSALPPTHISDAAGRLRSRPEGHALGRLPLDDDGEHAPVVRRSRRSGEKARRLAPALEAAEADIVYRDGAFEVAGTDRRISLFELATRRREERRARRDRGERSTPSATVDTPQTFPNGCHVAEVEIDPETGVVEIVTYTAVDDCGNVLNHTLVEGQVHRRPRAGHRPGADGAGRLRADSGQLVTGTFNDYAMPRADDMPPIQTGDASGSRRPPIRSA